MNINYEYITETQFQLRPIEQITVYIHSTNMSMKLIWKELERKKGDELNIKFQKCTGYLKEFQARA